MVNYCAVRGCRREAYPGSRYTFHRFPNDEERKLQWMKLVPGKITKYSAVCCAHFKSSDYLTMARSKLKPEAIPSIFPVEGQEQPSLDLTRPRSSAVFKRKFNKQGTKLRELQSRTSDSDIDDASSDTITVPNSPTASDEWACRRDVCRCCLAAAGTRLADPHVSSDGQTEDYIQMLQDCYGITLSILSEWGPNRLICNDCVNSLRAAHDFKQKVLRAEKQFSSYHSRTYKEINTEEDSDNTDVFEGQESEIYIDANTNLNETEQNRLDECEIKSEDDTDEVDHTADQTSVRIVEVVPKATLKRPNTDLRKSKRNNKRKPEDPGEEESDNHIAEICYVYKNTSDILGSGSKHSDENVSGDKNLADNRPGKTKRRPTSRVVRSKYKNKR